MSDSPKTLTAQETDLLLQGLLFSGHTHKKNLKGLRNYLIALLMLDAGLRVGEVTQLLTTDLWCKNSAVTALYVRSEIAKGKQERLIPLTRRIQLAIEPVKLNWWSQSTIENPWAFTPTPSRLIPLSIRQVERIIRQASSESIGREIYPHILRHTFASRLMRTTNARVVQDLLGHKRLTSTQIYTHPNSEDLTNAINSLPNQKTERTDYVKRNC